MACLHPHLVVDLGVRPDGKHNIKFLSHATEISTIEEARKRYEVSETGVKTHRLLFVPCGHCPECIKRRRKTWALRCELEAKQHAQNCFITLTYDDKHYPGQLVKKDVQLFIKYLARSTGWKQRYFLCGEYGGLGRGHYHLILFGFFPIDAKPVTKTESGVWSYSSKIVSKCWNKGFVMIEDFAPAAASYVAGYVEKKMDDKDCFIMMSTRPGIGRKFAEENMDRLYLNDNIVGKNGNVSAIPRYFDKVAEQLGVNLTKVKRHRLSDVDAITRQMMRDYGVNTEEALFEFNKEHLKNTKRRSSL